MRIRFGSGLVACALAVSASPATAASGGTALSWRPGPASLVYPAVALVRLSADKVLAYGSAVGHCAGVNNCEPDPDSAVAVAIWDTAHGTSTRAADPPSQERISGNGFGAAVDGDVYLTGSSRVPAGQDPNFRVLRYRSATDKWDLLSAPPGIGARIADYHWVVASGRPALLNYRNGSKVSDPAGAILAADGTWHLLPADPLPRKSQTDSNLVVVGNRLLALVNKGRGVEVRALSISDHGAVGRWRTLPSINEARHLVTSDVATVDGELVWHDLVYDPSTGRSTPTPVVLRARTPNQHTDNVFTVPDGLVLGDRVTISGALFDPRSQTWSEIPTPPNHDPDPNEPKAPQERVRGNRYDYLGGPEDIVRLYEGDLVETGSDPGPVTYTARPGKVDVLRPGVN